MDKLHIQYSPSSQDVSSHSIHARRVSPYNQLSHSVKASRDGLSSNARRLELRNAHFRAPPLSARRVSPPPTNIGCAVSGWAVGDENLGISPKARDCSSTRNSSPLAVLREINNSSQRPSVLRHVSDSLCGFESDGKEPFQSPCPETMLHRARPVKSVVHRKKVKRASPSSESTKYIEYLEEQLSATTTRLEALRSPETVKGQAAKIRKLEKRVQELSQHVTDWEDSYEERVNDEVFERLHGESDLRLKILTLEEAAGHKEAHISDLTKELEEAKTKLLESESVEVILNKRVDVLTELLAKSPTRTSFPTSNFESAPSASSPRAMTRISTSPTRTLLRPQPSNSLLQSNDLLASTCSISATDCQPQDSLDMDHEGLTGDVFSRPASTIFSSHSSHSSFSRPTSVFSLPSFSALEPVDEKAQIRPRRSRRFAPGSNGLKPLLLPATAGLAGPEMHFETPGKRFSTMEVNSDLTYDSTGSINNRTPCRPAVRRPYSWTPSSEPQIVSAAPDAGLLEEETIVGIDREADDLPIYLRHLASLHLHEEDHDEILERSPPPAMLSLHQELELELEGASDDDTADNVSLLRHSSRSIPADQATERTDRKATPTGTSHDFTPRDAYRDSIISESTELTAQSGASDCRTKYQLSDFAGAAVLLRQRSLILARQILRQSWNSRSARLGGFVSWLLSFSSSWIGNSPQTPKSVSRNVDELGSSLRQYNFITRPALTKFLLRVKAVLPSDTKAISQRQCPYCVEPSGKRKFKLWTKFALAVVLAIGYAMIEGPGVLLESEKVD